MVPDRRKSLLRAIEHAFQTIVSRKAAYTNMYNRFGTMDNAISYAVAAPNAVTDPYLRVAEKGQTE